MKRNWKKAILIALALGVLVSLTNLSAGTNCADKAVNTEQGSNIWLRLGVIGYMIGLAACSRGQG
jgi:hypothetical protein